ncbi:MAG: KamA family radical SAM protein [Thermodesulfobacteriota bacterium]
MENWQKAFIESLTSLKELSDRYPIDANSLQEVVEHYPFRVTRYYFDLIREPNDPIWRQCIPNVEEIKDIETPIDPLNEKGFMPVPFLIHRYPDRVVLLVSPICPTLCRFCTRKHYVRNHSLPETGNLIDEAIEYIEKKGEIRDVVLSGGDPLLLPDENLDQTLCRLRRISHLEILRINTRIPVTLPERITPSLCKMLKTHHPLFINIHFNHPLEITPQSSEACACLADAGIPLGSQTVLLKGVNDDLKVVKQLMQRLLTLRVRPYYIHQLDRVRGTSHFRTSVKKGLRMIAGLRGHTSGMAVPHYVIDLPGGKGKVSLLPEDVKKGGNVYFLRNYLGEVVEYQDDEE